MNQINYHACIAFLAMLFSFTTLVGQISQPGIPASFHHTHLKNDVPVIKMVPVDVAALLQEDLIFDTIKDIPWRFGKNIPVSINPDSNGIWEYLENGDKLWRTSIHSPGAYTLNLTFNQYHLPPGARLFVYNEDKSMVIGAFTDFNNQEDGYFATTLVDGDLITIEYYEPADAAFAGELNLETVTHAYRNPYDFAKGFGSSGWCNLNVACPEAEGWEQHIRSVALIVVGGGGFCTGALINNTEFDGKPFFLSANHCFSNPGSMVLWFNWQSETCANPPSSPAYNAMSGATQRARHAASDFWLVELNQSVPEEFNPYFAGWNRTLAATLNETIVGIHHPRGDIKKFSYAETGVQAASYGGGPGSGNSHWRIVWSGGTTTEPTSSGSPIFDAEGLIIGQLHGGGAACGNTLPDWYGRLGISWTGGGTVSTRLSDWLDPLNLDPMTLSGFDPLDPGVENPESFTATTLSADEVLLQWDSNSDQMPVMVAVSESGNFGKPEGFFTLGDLIDDEGRVIYMGYDQQFIHQNLIPNQHLHYKIWSYNENKVFSNGLTTEARTFCETLHNMPFSEGFNDEVLPGCWKQVMLEGETQWQIGVGNGDGYPFSALEGDANAFFRVSSNAEAGNTTRLITPVLDISAWQNASLSFYYANPSFQNNQDVLRIFYQPHAEEDWILLETLDTNQFGWEIVLLELPEISASARIAFEAEANLGRGISLDNVEVLVSMDEQLPVATNLMVSLADTNQPLLQWSTQVNDLNKEDLTLVGFTIFRNGHLIAATTTPGEETYTDQALPAGDYAYQVQARFSTGQGTALSNEESVTIPTADNDWELTISTTGEGNTSFPPGNYVYFPESEITTTAFPAENWQFSHWLINGEQAEETSAEITFTIGQNTELEAVFVINEYEVTLAAHPEEAAYAFEGEGLYSHGETGIFSALPAVGYVFQYWQQENSIVSTHPTLQTPVTSHTTFTAMFEERNFMLELAVEPEGAGITTGAGTYGTGAEVSVSALPNTGWQFVHWIQTLEDQEEIVSDDSGHTFVLLEDALLTAIFEPATHTLTLETDGNGNTEPAPGEYTFTFGHELTVSAIPDDNWAFVKWIIDGSDVITPEHDILMDKNRTAVAIFEEIIETSIAETGPNALQIFPVPADQQIHIKLPSDNLWDIAIINLTGQQVKAGPASASGTISVNVDDLNPGVFIIRATGNGQVINGKFLID